MADLTTQQKATLKAAILANPSWSAQPNTNAGNFIIASDLNAVAVPDYVVWRTSVSLEEIMRNGMDWSRVDNLSVGKARIWDWMGRLGVIDPSQSNIRAGIDATWVGTAADLAVRALVYVQCKRKATVVEKLLATGTGTDASPSVMGYEGVITPDQIEQARA